MDRSTGLICDQTIRLTGTTLAQDYPAHLRRVAYRIQYWLAAARNRRWLQDEEKARHEQEGELHGDFTERPPHLGEPIRKLWKAKLTSLVLADLFIGIEVSWRAISG